MIAWKTYNMISKEKTWQGLRLELSRDGLREIYQGERFEKDNYYDYDLFMNVLKKEILRLI